MAEGLRENHAILGIHMIGNEAQTDALGFVVPCVGEAAEMHTFTRIGGGLNTGGISNRQLIGLRANSNCWICEGWT